MMHIGDKIDWEGKDLKKVEIWEFQRELVV
jgi:hypothetical protein